MSQSVLVDLSTVSVMCIDDDPVMRSVIRFGLRRHGCLDVVQANGGLEALKLSGGRNLDLLICDFQMSPMNGLEFLRELGRTGHGQDWPVIMLSAETNPATIQEAQDLGVRAWLGKPISIPTLIERVGTVLNLHGQSDPSRRDPGLQAVAERHQARLMAGLQAAEEAAQNLILRPRETVKVAQGLRLALEDVGEHARILGYGLLVTLVARAIDLVAMIVRNPAVAARGRAAISNVLIMLLTAMKRVGHNRMGGDGGEAGLRLLGTIDGLIVPIRVALG